MQANKTIKAFQAQLKLCRPAETGGGFGFMKGIVLVKNKRPGG